MGYRHEVEYCYVLTTRTGRQVLLPNGGYSAISRQELGALESEGCPLIERASMSAENFTEAERGSQHACTNKRLKATPLGSLDLDFLSDAGSGDKLRKLSNTERCGRSGLLYACIDRR